MLAVIRIIMTNSDLSKGSEWMKLLFGFVILRITDSDLVSPSCTFLSSCLDNATACDILLAHITHKHWMKSTHRMIRPLRLLTRCPWVFPCFSFNFYFLIIRCTPVSLFTRGRVSPICRRCARSCLLFTSPLLACISLLRCRSYLLASSNFCASNCLFFACEFYF